MKRDRVLVIPRGEEFSFSYLAIDCTGPMFPKGDATATQPKFNDALVVDDLSSRWPMAYPLSSMNAQAVCECLLQIFMTLSIPWIISSDSEMNFTSQLTQLFLKSF